MGERCRFCAMTLGRLNKQGRWAPACAGCKGTLTRWYRLGRYTERQLLAASYSWDRGADDSWLIPERAPDDNSYYGRRR